MHRFVAIPLAVVATLASLLSVFDDPGPLVDGTYPVSLTELVAGLSIASLLGIAAWHTPSERFYDRLSPRAARSILYILSGFFLLTTLWGFIGRS